MSIKTELLLSAADLAVGDSLKRQECPSCRAAEHSFSITRQELGVLYNCFRASCGFRGFVPTHGALYQPTLRKAEAIPNPYRGELLPLDATDREWFYDRFEVVPTMGLAVTEEGCYTMAVYRPDGRQDALIVRRGGWRGAPEMPPGRAAYVDGPKTVLYRDTGRAATSWYHPAPGRTLGSFHGVVIVEDCISAMKVAQAGVWAVALLGAELNDDKVREIAQEYPSEVILALDKDAIASSFRQARKYGLAFKKIRTACLERDLKDEARQNVLEVLGL